MHKEELKLISQAILNEVEAYEFYRMAANQAGTNESKEAFLELAKEELAHVNYLKELFNSIKEDEKVNIKSILNVVPPSPGIYNWEIIEREHLSLAMAVFGIGIQMEKDSIEFYTKAKEESKHEGARELFNLLIKWEKTHLEEFTQQYNRYKEDWWSDQGFAPF